MFSVSYEEMRQSRFITEQNMDQLENMDFNDRSNQSSREIFFFRGTENLSS